MINWPELKHMHVVRKLESILAQWFNAEVIVLDTEGRIVNFDPLDRALEHKNPLANVLFKNDTAREQFLSHLSSINGKIFNQPDKLMHEGVFGFERGVAIRIVADEEFLGCLYVYSILPKGFSIDQLKGFEPKIQALGFDPVKIRSIVESLKVLDAGQSKYCVELVELLAQEIVTFHTEIAKREEKISALNNQLGVRYSYDSMIGKSKPMQDLYAMLDKIKSSESTVLIQGENGTGKELIARAIHFNSPRKSSQFVTVNCSAFNENLLDSELFGHVKGSFTGAIKDKKGLFEVADRGTLFLDEIGDMSLTMQVKLLRILQQGTFTPVGSTDTKKVDVRVVAATNRDLKAMIELGTFREDLYYRINVINLVVPPLRDRKEDIPILLEHFLARGCKEKSLQLKQLAKRALEKVYDYPWPGNIRELENEIERLIVLSGDEVRIAVELLSARIRDFGESAKVQGVRVSGKLKDALEELEKTMIKDGLKRTGWNKSRLAKELGISRAGLIMKVDKYGLDKRKIARDKAAGEYDPNEGVA